VDGRCGGRHRGVGLEFCNVFRIHLEPQVDGGALVAAILEPTRNDTMRFAAQRL
jgi:hypothetical protein